MTGSRERLLYVDPKYRVRDSIDRGLDFVFLRAVREIETSGTEANIPQKGGLVVGFAPHNGWIEPIAIDHFLRKKRADKRGGVWVTRKENAQEIPAVLTGERRFIYIDRDYPKPSIFRKVASVLQNQGVISSAFEGTRYGSGDREGGDILTLGKFKPGLVLFARRHNIPILPVVVLGAERIIPSPEKIKVKYGILGVVRELIKEITAGDDLLQVRFLPLYDEHLSSGDELPDRDEFLNHHTRLLAEKMVGEIRRLRTDYPLGYYREGGSF